MSNTKERLELLKQKSCHTCQNMSCKVESDEKPIFDCIGYMNKKNLKLSLQNKGVKNEKNFN